jgi:phosphohistidine swiveling domain-containing protein
MAARSFWRLNQESLAITRVDEPREPAPLSHDNVRDLRAIVAGMRAEFGEVRVEWLRLADGSVMLWDLTVEDGAPLVADADIVVSPGHVRGRAVVADDLSELEEILRDRSVIADRDFFLAQGSDRTMLAIQRLFQGIDRPIVVTPWPKTTLALLLGHAAGFVFDDAPLLSHLPIILREHEIPAIRVAGSTATVRTGDLIEIGPGGVRTLP